MGKTKQLRKGKKSKLPTEEKQDLPEVDVHAEEALGNGEENVSERNPDAGEGTGEKDGAEIETEPVNEVATEVNQEIGHEEQEQERVEPTRKRKRGPTKMKHIAKDPSIRERVEFNDFGEPCGPGSVKLSSYLGPLVREHVPYNIDDWRKIGDERRTVLWKSIQARFELDEEFQKTAVFKQMGCIWRSSKSRVVSKIREAKNMKARMELRPKNIAMMDWRKFINDKTSSSFKVTSDSYKERRKNQIPHTCSRKGIVRLTEEMRQSSDDPSKVTRLNVWIKSRTKKDGTPVSRTAAEKITKARELEGTAFPSSSTMTNPKEDLLTQILGPDNPGRLRAMGRGMNMSKLACYQAKNKYMAQMEENQLILQQKVSVLESMLMPRMGNTRQDEVGETSAPKSVHNRLQSKCLLIDWCGTEDTVAEGRLLSDDPDDFVNDIPLGPNSVKVLVETATNPQAFLWRPASKMFTIADAVGQVIAWPADCWLNDGSADQETEPKSPCASSKNKCQLMDWASNDEPVAIGRWQSRDPQATVNGLPLGPNAVKVYVDVVLAPDAFLWRPTIEMTNMACALKSFVAWPANRVEYDPEKDATVGQSQKSPEATRPSPQESPTTTRSPPHVPAAKSSPQESPTAKNSPEKSTVAHRSPIDVSKTGTSDSLGHHSPHKKSPAKQAKVHPPSPIRKSLRNVVNAKVNQKCKLMDITGNKRVVAIGRWASNNPDQTVHFVKLGPDAVRVWVDVVKIKSAAVWRPSSAIETMEDALGSSIAWPEDKVVMC